METKAKLPKKLLSMFLAMLMIFSACYVGIDGAYTAYAAAEDSEYTPEQVIDLVNAATVGGFTLSSSADEFKYNTDDGKVLAAAEAIFDYAVNAYREGKETTSKGNSSAALYEYFTAAFESKYANKAAADSLVKNVLNPNGTAVFSMENAGKKDTTLGKSATQYTEGQDVTANFPYESNKSMYATGVAIGEGVVTTKTVNVSIDLNRYLQTFETIDEIPSSFIQSATYTYNHMGTYSATVSKVDSETVTEGEGCDAEDVTYYTPTITTSVYNYMTAKPARKVVKNTTAKKDLLSYEKYFTEARVGMSVEEMLSMPIEDIEALYKTTDTFYAQMVAAYSAETLAHFGLNPNAMAQFMENVYFAYRVVAGKHNIDILNTLINSKYNEESYAEMSALYAKTNTAYNVVYSMDTEIINYIVGEGGYAEQYASAMALKEAAASYNAVLFDVMTEQKLEETVAAMVATFEAYINVLNKEDIDNPNDAEVIGLDQKVKGFDSVIATYTGKSYYRNYWTEAYESEWNRFKGILAEVYEVRGLKAEFQTHYDFFLPLIFTTQMDELDNEGLIALHGELETKLTELRTSYTDVGTKWGYTIADKIFTVTYDSNDDEVQEPFILQTLVDKVKGAGKDAAKTILIARTEAQLDAVNAYKDTTTVDFTNFASIKSTLTYFDKDLYNYVIDNNLGLSQAYKDKYAMVQTLLDRYHAFSTTSGKSSYDELKKDFGFADENGYFAVRPAGDQVDGEGNQIGYPNDIARDGADDNYNVTEDKMLATVAGIDRFVNHRDFGALLDFVDEETEDAIGLKDYINQMLEGMLYTDEMMNTIVGAIFPMICELIEQELVGAVGGLEGATVDENGVPWLDLKGVLPKDEWYSSLISGSIGLYLGDTHRPGNPEHDQKNFMEVFKDVGLNIYPATLADSLMLSNPASYGVGTPIYEALKAAGRDWTQLVMADDPETPLVDETKAMEFEWGVYDEDTFIEVMGCILDSILPLLQAVLTDKVFEGESSNAAVAYSEKVSVIGFINANKTFIRGGLKITIDPLNAWNTIFTPLFEVLGIEKIPTVKADDSGYDIAEALIGTLLGRVDEILDAPLSNVLDILPDLVYFISMDTIQEILNGLNIHLNLNLHELDVYAGDGLGNSLLSILEGTLAGMLEFPLDLKLSEELDLYDLLGFEISDFNEILNFALGALGGLGGEEGGLDLSGLTLPPIRQQDIILCTDWPTNANGTPLDNPTGKFIANKGELMYWFLDYVVKALVPDENGNSLLTSLLGSDMDPKIQGIIEKVVSQLTGNPKGALAAIIELLNPATNADGTPKYDLTTMNWLEDAYNGNGIEGATQMSIVYLNYGNDWTREKAEYLTDNLDSLVETIMEMVEADLGGAESIGAFLAGKINGFFTNDNITKLVKMLGGLGDSPSAVINDVVKNQVGIDIESWFTAFGYLYPAETWAEDAEIILPGSRYYANNFGVEGVANEDGTISWSFNKMPLVDGDGYTFVNILSRLIGPADLLIKFLFAGKDVSAFEDLLIIKGYETYDTSLGLLLEMLGVENLPTQADFNADAMGSFTNLLTAVLDWFYALTSSETMIKDLIEVLPELFYFIESNGLSTLLHNLLMPIWVLVDTVRPLIDVDINGVLSLVVSEFLNYGSLNIDTILQYVVDGIYMNDDPDFVWFNIDINNITFSEIIKLADLYLGTNLYNSGLVQIGFKGFCSGLEEVENTAVGTVYKPTIDAADTITLLVTALLDSLSYIVEENPKVTNGDVLFAFIAEKTGNEKIAGLYPVIAELIAGLEVTYTEPNWGYLLKGNDTFATADPRQTIEYLDYYNTDWTEDKAKAVYESLDGILEMFLPDLLEEQGAESLAQLVEGILEDNVYTDEILNTIIETIVNLLAGVNQSLFETIDVVLDTNIASWFTYCTFNEETGEYECTKDWGIATADDKAEAFKDAIVEVLEPADALLAFVFFGEDFNFFNASKQNDDGTFVADGTIININGIEGYDRAIVPILRALGIELPAVTTTSAAVGAILDGVFALVDRLSTESPVQVIFELLPNLIYFINADGLKSSVNNLLIPVNELLAKVNNLLKELNPEAQDISLDALLGDKLPEGLVLTELTTETLLNMASKAGITISNDEVDFLTVIKELYVGKFEAYTYAESLTGYTLNVEGYEGDVLTIVLSLALELFTHNAEFFADLFGEDGEKIVSAIISILENDFSITYSDIDWGYMYDGEDIADRLQALEDAAEFPAVTFAYLAYSTDWSEDTAKTVYDALDNILDMVMPSILGDENEDLKALVENLLDGSVYTDANLETIVELIVNALAGFDANLRNIVDIVLDTNISAWFAMCETTTDAEGNTVYEVPVGYFGVDAAADKKTAFVNGIKTVLAPANALLEWLFFGGQYTFFNDHNGEVIITLKGGQGYAYGLVPILEALGCTMQPALNFYNAETKTYDVGAAVEGILNSALALLENLATSESTVQFAFTLIPNLLYFINAGGLNASVANLLAPVNAIIPALKDVVGADNVQALLSDLVGFDLSDLSTDVVLGILEDEVGFKLDAEGKMLQVIKDIYALGKAAEFDSANGKKAYRVNVAGKEYDVLTVILSFALDAFKLNKELFTEILDEEIYNVIYAYLSKEIIPVDMQEFDWILTDKADTGEVVSPVTLGGVEALYGELYTREMGQYIEKWLPSFVDTMIVLLGIQGENGANYDGLEDILTQLIGTSLYTKANLQSILEAIQGLIPTLKDALGEELYEVVVDVLLEALEIDLNHFNTYTIADFADGDREAFVDGLVGMFKPLYPILKWLLTGENLVVLFNTIDGDDAIVIEGAKGYAYGIVPLLEAFDYNASKEGRILSAAEFEAQATDAASMLKNVLTPLLDVVDKVLADPVNEIFNVLPGIIYFLNSNGLDTVIKNTANAVFTILENIKPITGELDIYELIGFDAANMNIETLLEELLAGIEEDTGFKFADVAINAITDLTVGEIISIENTNNGFGEAYSMKYANGADRVDMVTTVLSAVLTFISVPENVVALEGMLEGVLDGDGYKFVCSLLENFSQMAASEGGIDEIMYTVYHIFYAANVAAHSTEDWLAEFNGDYSFLNQLFATSDLAFIRQLGASLGDLLNKFTGDIIDDDELAPNGLIAFFQKIVEFFQKIADFFKNLFS